MPSRRQCPLRQPAPHVVAGFKQEADVIVANGMSAALGDVAAEVYSRNFFDQD